MTPIENFEYLFTGLICSRKGQWENCTSDSLYRAESYDACLNICKENSNCTHFTFSRQILPSSVWSGNLRNVPWKLCRTSAIRWLSQLYFRTKRLSYERRSWMLWGLLLPWKYYQKVPGHWRRTMQCQLFGIFSLRMVVFLQRLKTLLLDGR